MTKRELIEKQIDDLTIAYWEAREPLYARQMELFRDEVNRLGTRTFLCESTEEAVRRIKRERHHIN